MFYYEYDEVSEGWSIYEEDAGHDNHGMFDVFQFDCLTEEDAIEACKILNAFAEEQ